MFVWETGMPSVDLQSTSQPTCVSKKGPEGHLDEQVQCRHLFGLILAVLFYRNQQLITFLSNLKPTTWCVDNRSAWDLRCGEWSSAQ